MARCIDGFGNMNWSRRRMNVPEVLAMLKDTREAEMRRNFTSGDEDPTY